MRGGEGGYSPARNSVDRLWGRNRLSDLGTFDTVALERRTATGSGSTCPLQHDATHPTTTHDVWGATWYFWEHRILAPKPPLPCRMDSNPNCEFYFFRIIWFPPFVATSFVLECVRCTIAFHLFFICKLRVPKFCVNTESKPKCPPCA